MPGESRLGHPIRRTEERRYRLLVRNMRTARELADALGAAQKIRKRDGRVFHVLPPALFDDVVSFLTRMGGDHG